MADTLVQIDTKQGINWAAKGIARRLQNIINALNTHQYEVAYDRTFGRNPGNRDKPQNEFIQAIIAETYEIVPEIDTGASVVDVVPEITDFGDLNLKVVIGI